MSIFDLTIIYDVYLAHKGDEEEATNQMLYTQLGESVSESVPQILLQSVFIIRTWKDENDNIKPIEILLIFASIFASLLSISSKFIKIDARVGATIEDRKDNARLCSKENVCLIVSHGWLFRALLRLFQVMTRIIVYVMTWSVMGGWFTVIYLSFEYILLWIEICIIFVGKLWQKWLFHQFLHSFHWLLLLPVITMNFQECSFGIKDWWMIL